MKRSKSNINYYNQRILKLFEIDPDYKSVKKRYDTLKLLLQEKYPFVKEVDTISFLKDVVYLDRKLRQYNEGNEEEEKEILEQEALLTLD